eukprot:scaffold673_cov410-Prasinococcus_capsulatus_cf.AAC.11
MAQAQAARWPGLARAPASRRSRWKPVTGLRHGGAPEAGREVAPSMPHGAASAPDPVRLARWCTRCRRADAPAAASTGALGEADRRKAVRESDARVHARGKSYYFLPLAVTLNLKWMISPSSHTYILPSCLYLPAALTAFSLPSSCSVSYFMTSAQMNPRSKSV